MMPTVLTGEPHTIYTLDSDLSLYYSKLLALWNLSNLSYFASFLEKKSIINRPYCKDPRHSCRGNT